MRERDRQLEDANEALRQGAHTLATALDAAQRLQEVATESINAHGVEGLYEHILDTAVAILHSDFASIQMFYPERGTAGELRLLGHRGFNAEAAKRWEWVQPSTRTTCGEALRSRQRVVVSDVRNCDFMAGSEDLEGYLGAGIHAVQTTPLVSRSGALLGMVSTHWREPHELSATELRALDVLVRMAADLIERSRAAEELRQSEELLRSAQRLARVGIWEWDFRTNQVSWSDEEFEVFGQPRDYEPSYEGFFQAVIPQEREWVARELRDAVANKRGVSSQVHIIRPDGELRTISFVAEVRFDAEGSPVGMFGATQDITDVKKNEAKLLQSQKDLQALTARLLDLQEARNKDLARELHDDLSQKLVALSMDASALSRSSAESPDVIKGQIRVLGQKIGGLADDVHRISRQLHPAILDDLGLEAALKEECTSFTRRLGIPVRFKATGVPRSLPGDIALCLFRVAQEILHNIEKHAAAKEVRVRLARRRADLALFVEDTGNGFDIEQARKKGGLGLISMEERVRLVNGDFKIRSQPGSGTVVEIHVALPENAL